MPLQLLVSVPAQGILSTLDDSDSDSDLENEDPTDLFSLLAHAITHLAKSADLANSSTPNQTT